MRTTPFNLTISKFDINGGVEIVACTSREFGVRFLIEGLDRQAQNEIYASICSAKERNNNNLVWLTK